MKIYISKSNLANNNHLLAIRQYLLDNGHEVIEHSGGEYDPSNLLNADKIIILGHEQSIIEDEGTYLLGRGIFGELINFATNGKGKENCFIAATDTDIYRINSASEYPKEERDWARKWGYAVLGESITLKEFTLN